MKGQRKGSVRVQKKLNVEVGGSMGFATSRECPCSKGDSLGLAEASTRPPLATQQVVLGGHLNELPNRHFQFHLPITVSTVLCILRGNLSPPSDNDGASYDNILSVNKRSSHRTKQKRNGNQRTFGK